MIRPMFSAAFVWIVVSWSPGALAQVLWQNAEYGMSVEEVRRMYPSAIEPEKPGTYRGGGIERLTLRNYDVRNTSFEVSFVFKEDQLILVSMKPEGELTKIRAEVLYRNLRELLKARYGDPLASTFDSGLGIITADTKWVHGPINVNLNLFASDRLSNLRIVYQAQLMKDAAKL